MLKYFVALVLVAIVHFGLLSCTEDEMQADEDCIPELVNPTNI